MRIKRMTKLLKEDAGMVLPLVIIVVISLALWTGAVLLLTRSTGTTIAQNVEQATLRQDLVRAAIEAVIPQLTPRDIVGADGYVETTKLLGIGSDYDTTRAQSCANKSFAPVQVTSSRGVQHQVSVRCAEATESGAQSPPATFILVGTGSENQNISSSSSQNCISILACRTGKDGGLRVDGNVATPTQVSGGLVNLSGAWIGVTAQTIALTRPTGAKVFPTITSPRLILNASGTPVSDVNVQCPASTGAFDVSNCNCPVVASDTGNTNVCLSGNDRPTLSTVRVQSPTSGVGNYLRSMTRQVVRESNVDFGKFINSPANVPGDCASPEKNASTGDFWAVVVDSTQGSLIGVNQLRNLNTLTGANSSCIGDGSSKTSPLLILRGIFRFELVAGVARSITNTNPNTWVIKNGNAVVIGGTPKLTGSTSASTCDPKIARTAAERIGVQFQMTGASYIDVEAGTLSLCPFDGAGGSGVAIVALDSYLSSYTPSASRILPWSGLRNFSAGNDEPYMIRTNLGSGGGSAPIFNLNGLILAPGASAYLALQASALTTFERGGVFRALTIRQNNSATASAALNPPRAANGDRQIQLRFWDSVLGDLGIVEVYIRDDFGVRPGYAYSYTVWRTMW
jgi:hypothetical protein